MMMSFAFVSPFHIFFLFPVRSMPVCTLIFTHTYTYIYILYIGLPFHYHYCGDNGCRPHRRRHRFFFLALLSIAKCTV